ncbi:hypothetical protein BGZ61DRAFT_283976, partial [Ilyonectria robusta]|uniref:uncharacterized protein n=1 Tax=Ilyonectria robusta TaxID=1079257 RepID=UPI001E8E1363
MSVGVGVGDFIKILELVTQARKRFVDAPSQYNDISNENFSNVVQDIDVLLSGCEPRPEQQAYLQSIRNDSTSLLKDLLERLDKDREIGVRSTSTIQCVKKAWKRFNWDPNDVQAFRSRISLNLALLNTIEEHSRRSSRIQQDVHHLTERSNQQERHEILKWIGTVDHGSRQSEVYDEHEEGTGEWLLCSDEFRKWIETKEEVLFCPGLPGAGKTFLASIVIQHLLDRFGNKSDVGIAYHYCDFRRQDYENASVILASILKQLAQCLGSLPDALSTLYDKHKEKETRPSFKEIASALQSLRGLQGVNALVTSRDIPEIVNDKELEGSSVLEIHASDNDVRKYLDGKMSKLGRFVRRDRQLQEDICKAILGSIGGMFLLARLHLDSLADKLSVTTLRNELAALPTGSSAYDKAYLAAMERIERKCPDHRVLAKDVLAWLTFAKRQLQVAELRAAVVVQETDSNLDEESLVDIEDMVSVCAGLVTVDERSQTVSLIHYTTQEYLERTRANWRPDADAAIATSCLTYLLFPVFDVEFLEVDED